MIKLFPSGAGILFVNLGRVRDQAANMVAQSVDASKTSRIRVLNGTDVGTCHVMQVLTDTGKNGDILV